MPVPPPPHPPRLTVVRAWTCLGINLFATPGLGSVMAGCKVPGAGQLLLAFAGFFLITGWMVQLFQTAMAAAEGSGEALPVPAWWWQNGVFLFGLAWLWSLGTGISLVRQAHAHRAVPAPPILPPPDHPVPPRL